MHKLSKQEMYRIAPIFENWNETMIWSCLQGHMGRAWTDNIVKPGSARIIIADFCFFAGTPDEELVKNIKEGYCSPCIIMVPENEEWGKLIEQQYQSCQKFIRYSFKKEPGVFNRARLQSYIDKLPQKYVIRKIDEQIFNSVKAEQWSKDLCSQFETYNEYDKKGLGFVITDETGIVCGASSYTVYDGGIEIEIDTVKGHRREGLALACASRLILECFDSGIYPSWDSANKASKSLAEKLGYNFDSEYTAYEVII